MNIRFPDPVYPIEMFINAKKYKQDGLKEAHHDVQHCHLIVYFFMLENAYIRS